MIEYLDLARKIIKSNFSRLEKPYKITFSITERCNSRCKHCSIWKKEPTNELTRDEIGKILRSVKAPWVNLTGGEITLRDDLKEIGDLIKENNGKIVNFATNSSLPDKIVENVKYFINLFEKIVVTVSLDGPKELHDEIRGVKGSWDNAMEVYSKLRKLDRENSNFKTYFGFTLFDENAGKLQETVMQANEEIGNVSEENFHLNIYHTSEHYYSNMGCRTSRIQEILSDVKKLRQNKGRKGLTSLIERSYLKYISSYLETGSCPLPCQALSASCFINPQGDVYPCAIWNRKLGNLRNVNYDLKKIWNSERTRETREKIKNKKCPGCWTPCEAYQSILGNLLRIK